ncbi:ABC transporter ATP-binding protein [Chloroflexia bacterium SDU3-3]|nr:ABC transporter ATP-binding protein [Chloroflexia bacterium SDU3-3]
MIKKLLGYVGEYRMYAIATPLFIIGEVIMEVLIPLVMAHIIDTGIQGSGGIGYTIKMGGLMVVMALISLLFGAAAGRTAAVAAMGFARNLRNDLFNKVQDFSFSNVDKFSTGSLVTRLTTDVTNTQNAFMMILRLGFRAPIMFISACVLAVFVNPRLSLIFLVAIPLLGTALFLIISKAHPRFLRMMKTYDKLNTVVQENLVGIRVVKAFVREPHENAKFSATADEVRRAQVFAEKLVILNMPIMQLSMYACIVAVLWFGGNMVVGGSFAIGQLSSFISYNGQILMSLMMLSMIFIISIISYASVDRIMEVLNEQPDIRDAEGAADVRLRDGSIEFRDVSFSYTGDASNPTLAHVSLRIESGQTIGIIGGTGSAKTSLVQLIPRLYDTLGGELLVGGHSVRDYPLHTLRSDVAMVLQKNVLFSGSIRDNIRWGDHDATDEQIIEACKAAQAHDFIMSFPDGYDTDLGQGGVNVSGGQKQRLCIARALLKRPKIIILDDSTSAVDTATDSKIRAAFKEKLKDTTTIIIAQRITSVSEADKIIVLNDGQVDGFGTHSELMAQNEIYREVYMSQQKGVEQYAGTNA